MKKVTSLLIAAFTTAVFAGSAMAAAPAQHTTQKQQLIKQLHTKHISSIRQIMLKNIVQQKQHLKK